MRRTSLKECRLLVVRERGQKPAEWRLSSLIFLGIFVICVLPASLGAALGARAHGEVHPAVLALGEGLLTAGVRVGAYALMPRLERPAEPPPPPPVPAVELPSEPTTPEARRGHLRVYSLHLHESLDVVPFDAESRPLAEAFDAISHLWRCRITEHEVPVHPRLVQLLTAVNDLYDRPVHLVSGHRAPNTIGTSPTSQHTMGTAADIRVPGVSTEELRQLVERLGGRGVGLYTRDRFVHVDFRPGRKYFWSDQATEPEEQNEQPRLTAPDGEPSLASTAPAPDASEGDG